MTADQLRKSILQQAIEGKLVPQLPSDEPASALLARIREEKARLVQAKQIKKEKNPSIIFRGDDNSFYEHFTLTGEVKCIDDEIPFEIPETWQWCRLGDICEYIQRGKSPKYSLIKKYPVIAQKCNQWSGFSIEKAQFIEPESISSYGEERKLQDLDLLWNSTGLGTLGRMAIYYSRLNPYELAVADSHVTVIRAFKQYVCPKYLYAYFSSNVVQSVIEEKSDGSTKQKELAIRTVKAYLLPLPPLSEQHRIVEKIEELMPLVEQYGKAQRELDQLNADLREQLKKSILQHAIEGKLVPQRPEDGTAEELLARIREEKARLVQAKQIKKEKNPSIIFRGDDNSFYEKFTITGEVKCIDEQIPFDIPESWQWCRLGDISNSYIGLTYKPSEVATQGTIVLRSSNIQGGKLSLNDVVRVKSEISKKLYLQNNDILICARNGSKRLVGKSAIIHDIKEPMTFGAFMAICRTSLYDYVYQFLQSEAFFSQLRVVSGTTTINQLTQKKFNSFLVPLPPLSEQHRIVAKIEELMQLIDKMEMQ